MRVQDRAVFIGVVAIASIATIFFLARERGLYRPAAPRDTGAGAFVMVDDSTAFADYAGSASCRDCHPRQWDAWAASHHGLAERVVGDEDLPAFDPARSFRHGTQSTDARATGGRFEITTLGLSNARETLTLRRVIGHDPLRQFIAAAPRGREQVLEAAYDPHRNEWFNVYGQEDRKPGEWGHWTGRGMAWNTMCASCHNTRLRKHYVAEKDSFHTTMAEMTVGCEACHGPMKAHAEWRTQHPAAATEASAGDAEPGAPRRPHAGGGGSAAGPARAGPLDPRDPVDEFSSDQWLSTCGSCHARRTELTGDFVPGEVFTDHYGLILPDYSTVYYPDGQVHDENYEYAAFLGSRMHGAGVRCHDCHDPHRARPVLEGNALCMRCHDGTRPDSPTIDPAAHTFHKPEGAGASCVGCHMPVTVYMQRHPRHDHGFTIPDPLLTVKNGTPNACNRCHTDRDARWALAAVEEWYGEKMNRPSRARARTVAAARTGGPSACDSLLALLAREKSAYWRAVAVGLLEAWTREAYVVDALVAAARDESPLARAAAARSLEPAIADPASPARTVVWAMREDPDRGVRVAAAWSLRQTIDPASDAGRDLLLAIDANLDHPAGRARMAVWRLARGEALPALADYEQAIEWDPFSPPLRHDYAVALSGAGRHDDALTHLEAAVKLAPHEADYRYSLALALAEKGSMDRAIAELEAAARDAPHHARAWYNLGLARAEQGNATGALEALREAERADPRDPRAPYARATIHAQRGEVNEARGAAQRALEIAPGFEEARRLLASLGP